MTALFARAAIGIVAAAAIALIAWRAGSLTRGGALAAVGVGAAAVAAGWAWGALLLLYFVVSSALSRAGAAEKDRLTARVVAKGGARDAVQVFANGGIFALCALGTLAGEPAASTFAAAAAGALAAATADTWATEIGTLLGGTPRALLVGRPVPPGTSGALSVAGSVAMIAGALFVASVARWLGLTDAAGVVVIAGIAGAVVDSLLGATLQERRWCDACEHETERRVHDCGAATRRVGGVGIVDNDAVNLSATIIGAVVAALLAFKA